MLNVLFRARKRDNPFGWIPDVPDFRDFRQSLPTQLMTTDLPPSADLRAFMPPVYDQGQLGSCTAQTMAAAVEYDRIKRGKASRRPSTLFLYYNSRLMEGTVNEDAGATLRTAAKVVNEYGAPPESYWPYRIPRYARRPYASAYRSGQVNQALRYARVDQTEQALKATLASGLPIAFGFAVYDSLMTQLVARTGVVPMPSASERMRVDTRC